MAVTDLGLNPSTGSDDLPPDSLFHNSAGDFTRLPEDWELEPGILEREAAEEALASSFQRVVGRGPESEDLAWADVVHRAHKTGAPIVEFAGVEEVLSSTGIEITEPTIDPASYQDAA